MPVTVEDLLQRLGTLKKIREPYQPVWKQVTDYVLPRRSFWDLNATPGKKPTQKLFDGTALTELQLLVDGMLGNIVSAHLRWIKLTMEDRRQNEIPWVRDWLEEVENVLYAEFARSNFYEAMSEFFLDAASIGTGIMLVEDDLSSRRILFSTRHMKECYLAEGRYGTVDTLYREFFMSNRQADQTWGNKLSVARQERVKVDPFGRARFIHACFPRAERDPGKIDQSNKAWSSFYIDTHYHNNDFIEEGGYDDFPYLTWRWRKNSDEIYGRSPAIDAIQDIMRLNQIGKSNLEITQLGGMPPLNVPESMRGRERIIPRGYNYYTNPKELIFPINLGQNYQMTSDQENEIRDQIRAAFRTKMFLLMEQLDKGPYTATEIRERQGEKATVQGPMSGRLNSETLIPLVKKTFTISQRNGLIPPPPPGLEQGGRIHIEFQGPLALQTKKYHQTQGIDTGMLFLEGMREMFPESLDNVDADELMRIGMDSKGMPMKTIRERPQVTEIREMRQEEAARQEQEAIGMEQQKLLADNAQKLNEPLKEDSMLAGIGKAGAKQSVGSQTGS